MTLIAILISLLLERLLSQLESLREPAWFERYARWLRERLRAGGELWEGAAGVVAVLLPLVVVVALVQGLLGLVLLGLPGFIFNVVVLLYCLGPRTLDSQVDALTMALESGDEETARRYAFELLGEEPPSGRALPGVVTDAVLVRANERLFAVLFWFLILGGVGAALYRGGWVLRERLAGDDAFGEAARRLQGILDWIPARLVAVGYALTGSFEDALAGWRAYQDELAERFADTSIGTLVCTGNGALRLDPSAGGDGDAETIHAANGLVWRTLIVWLTVIALITLAGWAT